MPYHHDISGCFTDRSGDGGLDLETFSDALAATEPALARLREWHGEGTLPLLHLPAKRDDIDACRAAADQLQRGATDVLVFGTGGSSLGAQALAQITGWHTPGPDPQAGTAGEPRPRVHFFENLDPLTMDRVFETLDLKTTRFLVVSKSGNTPETVIQMLAALDRLKQAGLEWNAGQHFVCLSEPGPTERNAVRHIASQHGLPVLDHHPALGGRYSVLSNVGILPAMLFGLDPVALREGAAAVLEPILAGVPAREVAPAAGAAVNIGLMRARGHSATVFMPYTDRLRTLAGWYVQLWAESLGKAGHGTTPVPAIGPADQHSQLQLFLDGPRDKLVTVITLGVARSGPRVDAGYLSDPVVGYLAGKSIGDLVDCQQRATAETLIRNARPTRVINVPELDERAMGALFMHFMLETIVTGLALGIDPFDQPAVEESKVLAREYLGQM